MLIDYVLAHLATAFQISLTLLWTSDILLPRQSAAGKPVQHIPNMLYIPMLHCHTFILLIQRLLKVTYIQAGRRHDSYGHNVFCTEITWMHLLLQW